MSIPFDVSALNPSHRYLFVVLSRFRRFINRSVASAIASRERQAVRFMQRKLGDRKLKDVGLCTADAARPGY